MLLLLFCYLLNCKNAVIGARRLCHQPCYSTTGINCPPSCLARRFAVFCNAQSWREFGGQVPLASSITSGMCRATSGRYMAPPQPLLNYSLGVNTFDKSRLLCMNYPQSSGEYAFPKNLFFHLQIDQQLKLVQQGCARTSSQGCTRTTLCALAMSSDLHSSAWLGDAHLWDIKQGGQRG